MTYRHCLDVLVGVCRDFGNPLQSRKGTQVTQAVSLDTLANDLAFTNPDQNTKSHPSYEGVHDPANYNNLSARDTPIGTEADDKGQAYSKRERY